MCAPPYKHTHAQHTREQERPSPPPEQILCQDQHRGFPVFCRKVLAYGHVRLKSKSESQDSLTPNSPHITFAYQILFNKHRTSGLCEALRSPWPCRRSQNKQMPQRNRSPHMASTGRKPVTGFPGPQRWHPFPHSRLVTNPTRSSLSRGKWLIFVVEAEGARPFRQKPRVRLVQNPEPGDD